MKLTNIYLNFRWCKHGWTGDVIFFGISKSRYSFISTRIGIHLFGLELYFWFEKI